MTAVVSTPDIVSFTSQRLRISYADWGNRDAPLLLLLHGGRDHKRSWDWTARALANDWHVVAPDLRGHGESEWVSDGDYAVMDYVYDLTALLRLLNKFPAALVGHSLGGNVVLRYAGVYPEHVTKLVAIEGLGPSPKMIAEEEAKSIDERLREWIGARRAVANRAPKRYPDIAAAETRMREANAHLSDEQVRHLTRHGVRRHEDGSVSFAFDPCLIWQRSSDLTRAEIAALWARIECPTLLAYGRESWASNPAEDGRASCFRNAEVELFDGAGHWLHHDRFEAFLAALRRFLAA